MLASKVWDSGTKPIDFVCNRAARRVLNLVPEMEKLLVSKKKKKKCPCLVRLTISLHFIKMLNDPTCPRKSFFFYVVFV